MRCSQCNLTMLAATKPVSDSLIQELVFCPKCRAEVLGKTSTGSIEVEDPYQIEIQFASSKVTLKEIFLLRKVFLSSSSVSEIKQQIHNKPILCFGEYTKPEAHKVCQKACKLGLKATVVVADIEGQRDRLCL